jgi:D-Tyr-tRNA(Tyr) deacylase
MQCGAGAQQQGINSMLTIIQRVREARVTVRDTVTGEIGRGLLVLLCAERGDTDALADKLLAQASLLPDVPAVVYLGSVDAVCESYVNNFTQTV